MYHHTGILLTKGQFVWTFKWMNVVFHCYIYIFLKHDEFWKRIVVYILYTTFHILVKHSVRNKSFVQSRFIFNIMIDNNKKRWFLKLEYVHCIFYIWYALSYSILNIVYNSDYFMIIKYFELLRYVIFLITLLEHSLQGGRAARVNKLELKAVASHCKPWNFKPEK